MGGRVGGLNGHSPGPNQLETKLCLYMVVRWVGGWVGL